MKNSNKPLTKNKNVKNDEDIDLPFYAIADSTHINHTTLATTEKEAIKEFMGQEQAMSFFINMGRKERGESQHPTPSWECYEAAGYRVAKVKIVEIKYENNSSNNS